MSAQSLQRTLGLPSSGCPTYVQPRELPHTWHSSGKLDRRQLTRQVYLFAPCHIGVANTTMRLPITTGYADRASTAAAKGNLPMTSDLETGIGFL